MTRQQRLLQAESRCGRQPGAPSGKCDCNWPKM